MYSIFRSLLINLEVMGIIFLDSCGFMEEQNELIKSI